MLVNGHEVVSFAARLFRGIHRRTSRFPRASTAQHELRTDNGPLQRTGYRVRVPPAVPKPDSRQVSVRTNRARRRFNLGNMRGFLASKLVKPTKVFCSWPSYEGDIDQFRFPQAKSDVRTVAAVVLREADATMQQKLCGFDSADRALTNSPNSARCSSVIVVRRY